MYLAVIYTDLHMMYLQEQALVSGRARKYSDSKFDCTCQHEHDKDGEK